MLQHSSLVFLTSLACIVNAENFTFGIYSDAACTVPDSTIVEPNPMPMDPQICNPWYKNFGPGNSIRVLACSSRCVCYEQSVSETDCNATDRGEQFTEIKEVCMNTCRHDNINQFIRIFDLNQCGDEQVSDDDYACPCTGMAENCICSGEGPCPVKSAAPSSTPYILGILLVVGIVANFV